MTALWTPPRTWATGEIVTAAMLNEQLRDNLDYLIAPPVANAAWAADRGDVTTTSTSYVDIHADFTKTLNLTTGRVLVGVFCNFGQTAATVSSRLALYVDGVQNTIISRCANYGLAEVKWMKVLTGLPAGSHTIGLKMMTDSGGTAKFFADGEIAPALLVMEV